MAKRTHVTELGFVVCEELRELGAGKDGWLSDDPNLLCALDAHSLAFASKFLIVVTGWSDSDGPRIKIRPELSPIEAERITALEWLVFHDIRVILVGTSIGCLMIYSLGGLLIHRQFIHSGWILKLRVRGTKRDLSQHISSEEVCAVMPGVIARFDGNDIQNILQQWFHDSNSQSWDRKLKRRDPEPEDMENSYGRLRYQLWNVSKYGSCADAAITGVMPPPLFELQSSQHYYSAITIGEDAVISAFRLSEDKSRSLVGVILSKVMPATFSTIASVSKMIWRSEPSPKKPQPKPQPFARASPLTCLKDHPRKGEKLTLSPSGSLAAITDSLGRILLLDTQALVVVRLWKGYRDANCLFMEMLVKRDGASSNSYYEPVKSDYCLCLAIHAPRKGIIEVWQMRTGPRLITVRCPKGSRMLQPTYRFGSPMASPYIPLEVFLLKGDSGQLSVLNRSTAK